MRGQFEAGVSFSTEPDLHIWKIPLRWLAAGYQFGHTVSGVRIYKVPVLMSAALRTAGLRLTETACCKRGRQSTIIRGSAGSWPSACSPRNSAVGKVVDEKSRPCFSPRDSLRIAVDSRGATDGRLTGEHRQSSGP